MVRNRNTLAFTSKCEMWHWRHLRTSACPIANHTVMGNDDLVHTWTWVIVTRYLPLKANLKPINSCWQNYRQCPFLFLFFWDNNHMEHRIPWIARFCANAPTSDLNPLVLCALPFSGAVWYSRKAQGTGRQVTGKDSRERGHNFFHWGYAWNKMVVLYVERLQKWKRLL